MCKVTLSSSIILKVIKEGANRAGFAARAFPLLDAEIIGLDKILC
jgi:hypothetical protein